MDTLNTPHHDGRLHRRDAMAIHFGRKIKTTHGNKKGGGKEFTHVHQHERWFKKKRFSGERAYWVNQ